MIQNIEEQTHGYRNGHQLLTSTIKLSRSDQDLIDRLSDIAGALRPGELFTPYITAYPLPSNAYYVFAKTWQDVDAPRAGCVLTRSLIIQISEWENLTNLNDLYRMLIPVSSDKNMALFKNESSNELLPPVEDHRIVELVEAMFLEGRQPIVYFEAPEAEIIARRILLALWPSLRKNFSLCTFTLAPRKLENKEFDLVFAPKSARSRFSEWKGRKIEVSNLATPRHKWSEGMATQIFKSQHPSLTASDSLGILNKDRVGDESALRLSLLWNELLQKVKTNPTAVLGMLDIINSQNNIGNEVLEYIAPIIIEAADKASLEYCGMETWTFFNTLVGKFPTKSPPKSVLQKIRDAASSITYKDPELAFEFLEIESKKAHLIPIILLFGIGNGLGKSQQYEIKESQLRSLSSEIGLSLLAVSASFARKLIDLAKIMPEQIIPIITKFVEFKNPIFQRKARRRLKDLFDSESLISLLPIILQDINEKDLIRFVIRIGKETAFQSNSINQTLIDASNKTGNLHSVRNALVESFKYPSPDLMIINMIKLIPEDIQWLYNLNIDFSRRLTLFLKLLANESDTSIQKLSKDSTSLNMLINTLLSNTDKSFAQLSRILLLDVIKHISFLEIGYELLQNSKESLDARLQTRLIEYSLKNAPVGDKRTIDIFETISLNIETHQLIRMIVSSGVSSEKISENLSILLESPPITLKRISHNIDDLSERLINLNPNNLGQKGYIAWAQLISMSTNYDSQLKASISSLAYALRLKNYPISAVIVVTFPIVYRQLLQSKGEEDFQIIPALLSLPMSFFMDWDRAKASRRDLVDAFMSSSWPPSDLMLAAIYAGIESKILKRVSRNHGGEKYIRLIENSIEQLDPNNFNKAKISLKSFRLNSDDEWL